MNVLPNNVLTIATHKGVFFMQLVEYYMPL